MNRNHLALFHAVAEAGSISGGAKSARVSQPAVSKQIAELEGELGVRLLDRLPRGCRLTEAGAILAEYARRWRAVESDAEHAIAEWRGLRRGRLALGASQTVGGYLLPSVLAEFHRLRPQVDLHLDIGNTDQIERKLADGQIEAGLTEGTAASDELESSVFFHDELIVIAPTGHPLSRRHSVTIQEVIRAPLILREPGSGTRAVFERAASRRRIQVQPFLVLSSAEAIKSAVAAGLGLAVVSRLVVAQELSAGTLAEISISNFVLRRPLHLQRLRGHTPSPALQEFLGLLSRRFAKE